MYTEIITWLSHHQASVFCGRIPIFGFQWEYFSPEVMYISRVMKLYANASFAALHPGVLNHDGLHLWLCIRSNLNCCRLSREGHIIDQQAFQWLLACREKQCLTYTVLPSDANMQISLQARSLFVESHPDRRLYFAIYPLPKGRYSVPMAETSLFSESWWAVLSPNSEDWKEYLWHQLRSLSNWAICSTHGWEPTCGSGSYAVAWASDAALAHKDPFRAVHIHPLRSFQVLVRVDAGLKDGYSLTLLYVHSFVGEVLEYQILQGHLDEE